MPVASLFPCLDCSSLGFVPAVDDRYVGDEPHGRARTGPDPASGAVSQRLMHEGGHRLGGLDGHMQEQLVVQAQDDLAAVRRKMVAHRRRPRLEQLGGGTLDDRCLLYTSPSPRDGLLSRMPSSA